MRTTLTSQLGGGKGDWIRCPNCDASCRERELSSGEELRCTRCGATVLQFTGRKTLQPALALSVAGLLALVLANSSPVLVFSVAGRDQSGYIITGVRELIAQGYWPIAALVFFAGILAPLLYLTSVAYVSSACCFHVRLPRLVDLIRLSEQMESWNLVPVYSIATVVSVVKLRMLGGVQWEFGAQWVLALAVISLFVQQTFNRRLVTERLISMGVEP